MNHTVNIIFRRSAKRIPVISPTAIGVTVSSNTHFLPLDAVDSSDNQIPEIPVIPIHRYPQSYNFEKYSGRFFSTSTTMKEQNNNGDDGMGDNSDNDSQKLQQSPLSSPLTNMNVGVSKKKSKKKKFVPRKAAVELTEKARTLFLKLIENHPTKDGILLNYNQSSTGEPRMVFSFSFVGKEDLDEQYEGVSLEVDEDGNPKSPRDALDDGLPKLYVHHNAFLKVLGATVDVDMEKITPVLYDKEGFELDANA